MTGETEAERAAEARAARWHEQLLAAKLDPAGLRRVYEELRLRVYLRAGKPARVEVPVDGWLL